jgi:hypothetical protein
MNDLAEANFKSIEVLFRCYDSLYKDFKWYNFLKWGRIIKGLNAILNSVDYLLYQTALIRDLGKTNV